MKLRYFSGLSVEKAAEALGIPRSTAYVQWSFARAALRVLLENDTDASSPWQSDYSWTIRPRSSH